MAVLFVLNVTEVEKDVAHAAVRAGIVKTVAPRENAKSVKVPRIANTVVGTDGRTVRIAKDGQAIVQRVTELVGELVLPTPVPLVEVRVNASIV